MPLPDTSQEFKNYLLQSRGYDPSKYSMDDEGYVNQLQQVQPGITPPLSPVNDSLQIPPIGVQTKPTTSVGGSLLHSAEASILPTAAGLGVGSLAAAGGAAIAASIGLAPETLGASLIPLGLGILGGAGAGYGASALQNAVLPKGATDQLALEQQQHPIASTIGGFIPSALALKPSLKGIGALGEIIGGRSGAISDEARQALLGMGINAGVQGGQDVASQLMSGQPFSPTQALLSTAAGGLLSEPYGPAGRALFPHPPQTPTDIAQQTVSPTGTTEPQIFPQPNPSNQGFTSPNAPTPEEIAGREAAGHKANQDLKLSMLIPGMDEEKKGAENTVAAMQQHVASLQKTADDINTLAQQRQEALQQIEAAKKQIQVMQGEPVVPPIEAPTIQPAPAASPATEERGGDNLKGIEGASTGTYSQVVPAETAVEKAMNRETRYQEEPADEEKQAYLFRNAPPEYRAAVSELAQKRGISLQEASKIITPEGKSVLGVYNPANRTATVSQAKGELDTPIHEVGHGFMEDLGNSSSEKDSSLYNIAMDIFRKQHPNVDEPTRERLADEAIARRLGVEGTGRVLGNEDGLGGWWKDYKARVKTSLGLGSDEDVLRHLSARLHYDPSFEERGAYLQKGPMALNASVKNQDVASSLEPTPNEYNSLSEEGKKQYSQLSSEAMMARLNHERLPSDANSDRLIDAEMNLKKFNDENGMRSSDRYQDTPTEKPDRAAIKVGNEVYTGSDHGQAIQSAGINPSKLKESDYGFMSDKGNFMSRADAAKAIGLKGELHSGQLNRMKGPQSEIENNRNYADRLAKMPTEERDSIEFNENYKGYQLYEARKLMPREANSTKIKKLTDDNNNTLSSSYDAIINVDGEPYGLTKEEDPDNEDKTVWSYSKVEDPSYNSRETPYDNIQEVINQIREDRNTHGGPQSELPPAQKAISERNNSKEAWAKAGWKFQEESSLGKEEKLGLPDYARAKFKPTAPNKDLSIPLLRSANDDLLAREGERARPLVNASIRNTEMSSELKAKYGAMYRNATEGLSATQKNRIEQTLHDENRDGESHRDELPTNLQKPYDNLRDMMRQMQEDRIEAGQPVKTINPSGATKYGEAKVDPTYWPNQPNPDVVSKLKEGDSPAAQKLRQEYIDFQNEHKISPEEASQNLDAIMGSYNKITPTMAHFRGLDVEQGHGLPYSFMRPGLDRNMERYIDRFSTGRAYHDTIESKPEVASLIGEKKTPWGEDLPEEYQKVQPLQSQIAHDIVGRLKGQDYNPEHSVINAAERIGSSMMLGPLTNIHILGSTTFGAMGHAKPSELPGMLKAMSSGFSEAREHAISNGLIRQRRNTFLDLYDAHSTQTEKLNAIADAIQKGTGRGLTDTVAKSLAQAGGEYLARVRNPLAKAGDEDAIRFMKQLDPEWSKDKDYDDEGISKLGSAFANILHGVHDSRTQPNWMLKDSIVQPFTSLAGWSIAQTNNFTKNVLTPAREGNFTPLIMNTMGAMLGGYIIKQAREALSGKKSPIPAFNEIANSGQSLDKELPLYAYNLMAMGSYAGYGGLLSIGAKDLFDLKYKNTPQGTAFPLDEVVSGTIGVLSHAASALMNAHDMSEVYQIGTHATADLFKNNAQGARIAINRADELGLFGPERQRNFQLAQQEGELRRWKLTQGIPVDEQGSDESNPYYNMNRKEFQRTRDINQAAEELPGVIQQAMDESGGNIETLKLKLQAIKRMNYPSMPSPENTPMQFWNYAKWLNDTEGPEAASKHISDYYVNNMINKAKGSMVPSF